MRAQALLAALLGCACAPGGALEIRVPPGALSIVLVERASATAPLTLYALDAAADPVTYAADRSGDPLLVALYYERSLDALALPEGTLRIATSSASARDSWPLPPESSRQVVSKGGLSEEALAQAVAGIRVPRPPCGSWRAETFPIGFEDEVGFAVPLGDGVLFGKTHDRPHMSPASVHFAGADGPFVQLGAPFVETSTAPRAAQPRAFAEGEVARVLWNDGRLWTVSSSLALSGPLQTTGALLPREIIARDGTVLMRNGDGSIARLVGGEWVRVIEPPSPRGGVCHSEELHRSYVLELEDATHGIAGFINGPIRRFDLDQPSPLLRGTDLVASGASYCTSSHARLTDGGEVVVSTKAELIAIQGAQIEWRGPPPDDTWALVEHDEPVSADAIAVIGTDILISAGVRGVVYFDHDPRRPDVAPRSCQRISLMTTPLHLVVQRDAVFAFGFGGTSMARLTRE